MNCKSNYIPHLEWEAVSFPLTISGITSDEPFYGFDSTAVLTVWRDDEWRLKGSVSGFIKDPADLKDEAFVKKGNIVKNKNLTCKDAGGNQVELKGLILHSGSVSSINSNENGFFYEGNLSIDSILINYPGTESSVPVKRLEWFVCSGTKPHFWGTTIRRYVPGKLKIRKGVDPDDVVPETHPGVSFSKDYFIVDLPGLKFIIAKVPDAVVNGELSGICFEFRNENGFTLPDSEIVTQIKHLVSFLLGNKLTHAGYSIIQGNELKQAVLFSIEKQSLQISQMVAMPPVPFNTKYEWSNFEWLVNNMLPVYLEKQAVFKLNQSLSRCWIARSLPVGVNLPLLANAMEIVAVEYLKAEKQFNAETIPEEKYLALIQEDLEKLETKLSDFKNGEIILNKIKTANKKGPNEKMVLFFTLLDLKIGKKEKQAIKLRNVMAHAAKDYTDDNKAFDDIVLTRVYEVLFNRVMLKLLGYQHYYTDYSVQGCPPRQLAESAGDTGN